MAVIVSDYKGNPITEHSSCSAFCKAARKDPVLREKCEKCDSRGGLEAARNNGAYIYLCHLGIVDFAIPIIVDGQYLGALMAGQVRLENKDNNKKLKSVGCKKTYIDYDKNPKLKELYNDLFVMSIEKIEDITHMIYHLIDYIVDEAVLKTTLYDITQLEIKKVKENYKLTDDLQKDISLYYPINNETEHIIKKEEHHLCESHKLSLIRPALYYIEKNYEKKILVEEMARLCNISSSYFSKIFKNETGLNFSNYVNNVKVRVAKKILETTTDPIINISLDLGFDDCGYFIKVFKKYSGKTPASYRKQFLYAYI